MGVGPRALVFDCDAVIADDEPLRGAAFGDALVGTGRVADSTEGHQGGAPRRALPALDRLRDRGRGIGRHLAGEVARGFVTRLQAAGHPREDAERALPALRAHGGRTAVHRLHGAAVRGHGLAVEIPGERAIPRTPTTGRRGYRLDARVLPVLVGLVLVAGVASAASVPGSGGRLQVGGYLDALAVVDTGGGPRERPQGLAALDVDVTPKRWLMAHAELRWRVGGPFEGGHPGHYNLSHAFQNYSPALEWNEAYAAIHMPQADLRAGVQKVAWGKLDGLPPTDVVNPRDYHDPLVADAEERKIGIPMLLGTWYLPDVPRLAMSGVRLTALWVPLAVPSRLALAEERWFPMSTVPPAEVMVPVRLAPGQQAFPLRVPLVSFRTRSERPPRDVTDGGVGLRLGGTWRASDLDLYYYAGPEVGPDADLRPTLFLASVEPLKVVVRSELRQANDSIQMAGANWAMTLFGVALRAEAAYLDDRPYLRLSRDLISAEALASLPTRRLVRQVLRRGRAGVPLGDLFPSLDAVEWGIGADYLWQGFLPLLQVNQVVILDPAPRLLIGDPETRVLASLRRRWLGERLEVELRGGYAVERGGWSVFPRVSYHVRDNLRVRLGYLAVGGPRTHILGQFGRNDAMVLQARYAF